MAAWPLIPLGLLIGVAAVEQLAGSTNDEGRTTKEPANHRSSFVLRPTSRLAWRSWPPSPWQRCR